MHSCLYEGQVRHRRFAPRAHSFRYRVFYAYLDLDELDQVFRHRWLWSTRRPALAWFRRSDYLGDKHIPLKQAVMDRVEQVTGQRPQGPIRLLTHLRYFGVVFNPVSFYYCFDQDDTHVECIVAEITNTPWGERHAYVLPINASTSGTRHLRYELQKDFHVSPFMPMDIDYQWFFSAPESRLNVHMVNLHQDEKMFNATLTLAQQPLTATQCARALLQYPCMTLKVIAAIYWQALKLFVKGIPFYTHPAKLDSTRNTGGATSAKSP
jgi:DUF1365 family protein